MEAECTCIIIEPRRHKALEFVLRNMLENTMNSWPIIVFHGTNNGDYVKEIVDRIKTQRIQLIQLNVDNLNQKTYSELLASSNIIYEHIHTKYLLIFQTDSMIFPQFRDLIHRYIEMDIDYVGAPWKISNYTPTKVREFIGNGGLSLRKKVTMLKIMEKHPWKEASEWLEDLYFTKPYEDVVCKKPSYKDAKEFCVDEVYSPVSFGCHKVWVHSFFPELVRMHPELQTLYNLQETE